MQYKVRPKNLSAIHALEQLQAVYKVSLASQNQKLAWDKIVTLKNEQKIILNALECSV